VLDRLLAGLVHPFIHLAYGLECGIAQGTSSALPPNALIPNNLTPMPTPPISRDVRLRGIRVSIRSRQAPHICVPLLHLRQLYIRRWSPERTTFSSTRQLRRSPAARSTISFGSGWKSGSQVWGRVKARLRGMVEEVVWKT